jgi:ribosomal protein L37E
MGDELVKCQRCGTEIQSYSPMRKWCVECRQAISLQQAKVRKAAKKKE